MLLRDFLSSTKKSEMLIESDMRELEQLRAMSTGLRSVNLSERVNTSRSNEAEYIRIIEKIYDLEEKINREIDEMVDRKEEIRELINKLGNIDERLCLKMRYIDFYSWAEIAEKMAFSDRQIYRIHERAISHLSVFYCDKSFAGNNAV